ncbi:MAG: FG-GAP-like repeat-containing protein [Saprospiraceae bacterium]|nr:FG-GAP-like repeat-containing protein [Saprospiraceae bacterium]
MRILFTLTGLLLAGTLPAQITFQKHGERYTQQFRSGVAVVCTDINGDTYDDLMRLNLATNIKVDLQGQEGSLFQTYSTTIGGGGSWNAIAGDVNNDGWPDLVTSGAFDKVKVLYATPFSGDFQIVALDGDNFFAQGANLVDINNDGFLDIFVCDDNATSDIYMNDSTGGFNVIDTIIDFTTNPPSDNSGNYGSVWNDIDNDGDLDLYIAKCRQGVVEPTDPRRINALFINQGDTAWVEMADSFGIAVGWQSWSPDFADIDNDGDLDLFVTNHDAASQLFENIDGQYFEDITLTSGIFVGGLAIQSCFHDFDNDGLQDLLISGTSSFLYRNIGNNQFLPVNDPFQGRDITSFALGDLNADGFVDVYATYNELFNTPSDAFDDAIWLQQPNDNNWVRIHLAGTICNRSAVGTRLTLHGAWGMQMREVQSGESYGITNSLIQMFGLGTADAIDSLVVRWPNGVVETHYDLPVNTTVTVEEGSCAMPVISMEQGPYTQCGSDTFEIQAPAGYAAYLWSNGMVSEQITVTEPGIYHVSLTDDQGCLTISTPVEIRADDSDASTEITVSGSTTVCDGDTITLTAPAADAYQWSDGSDQQVLQATISGTYTVTVTRACGDVESDPVTIAFTDPDAFETLGDTVLGSGSGTLTADGDSIAWFDMPESATPLGTGAAFVTPVVDTTTTFYAQNYQVIPGQQERVGMMAHGGGTFYNGNQFNGHLVFDVYAPVYLDSVLVMTDFPGDREVLIEDAGGVDVYRQRFFVDSGAHYLHLDVLLQPGEDYRIGTDASVNNKMFDSNSPQLVRSDGEVVYPYEIADVLSIKSTQFGQEFYYYFYDWHLRTMDVVCASPRVPVDLVVVDTSTQVRYLASQRIHLYPNPASDHVVMTLDDVDLQDATYAVFGLDGRQVADGMFRPSAAIDISALSPGMYLIEVRAPGMAAVGRFVKE